MAGVSPSSGADAASSTTSGVWGQFLDRAEAISHQHSSEMAQIASLRSARQPGLVAGTMSPMRGRAALRQLSEAMTAKGELQKRVAAVSGERDKQTEQNLVLQRANEQLEKRCRRLEQQESFQGRLAVRDRLERRATSSGPTEQAELAAADDAGPSAALPAEAGAGRAELEAQLYELRAAHAAELHRRDVAGAELEARFVSEAKAAQQAVEAVKTELRALREAHAATQARHSQQATEVQGGLEVECRAAKQMVARLEKEIEELDAAHLAKLEALQQRLRGADQESESAALLRSSLAQLKSVHAAELAELQTSADTANVERASLREEMQVQLTTLGSAHAAELSIQEQLQQRLEDECKAARAETERIRTEMEAELASMRATHAAELSTHEQLRQSTLEGENQAAKVQVERVRSEVEAELASVRAAYGEELSAQEQLQHKLEGDCQSARLELERVRSELQMELASVRAAHADELSAQEQLQSKLESLLAQSQADQKQSSIASASSKMDDSLAHVVAERDEARRRVAALDGSVSCLQHILEDELRQKAHLTDTRTAASAQESALRNEVSRLTKALRLLRLGEVFNEFDLDRSGTIEPAELLELGKARQALGQKSRDWTEQKNARLVSKIDANGDGKISCLEFASHFEEALPEDEREFESTMVDFLAVARACRKRKLQTSAQLEFKEDQATNHALARSLELARHEEDMNLARQELIALRQREKHVKHECSQTTARYKRLVAYVSQLEASLQQIFGFRMNEQVLSRCIENEEEPVIIKYVMAAMKGGMHDGWSQEDSPQSDARSAAKLSMQKQRRLEDECKAARAETERIRTEMEAELTSMRATHAAELSTHEQLRQSTLEGENQAAKVQVERVRSEVEAELASVRAAYGEELLEQEKLQCKLERECETAQLELEQVRRELRAERASARTAHAQEDELDQTRAQVERLREGQSGLEDELTEAVLKKQELEKQVEDLQYESTELQTQHVRDMEHLAASHAVELSRLELDLTQQKQQVIQLNNSLLTEAVYGHTEPPAQATKSTSLRETSPSKWFWIHLGLRGQIHLLQQTVRRQYQSSWLVAQIHQSSKADAVSSPRHGLEETRSAAEAELKAVRSELGQELMALQSAHAVELGAQQQLHRSLEQEYEAVKTDASQRILELEEELTDLHARLKSQASVEQMYTGGQVDLHDGARGRSNGKEAEAWPEEAIRVVEKMEAELALATTQRLELVRMLKQAER